MKKFATIILAAAMILSMTACGDKEEITAVESGEQTAEVNENTSQATADTSDADESNTTTESNIPVETTTSADTTTSVPKEEDLPTEEIVYEDFPQLEGEVTLLSELPFEGGSVVTAYEDTVLIKNEEWKYGLVNKAGEPISEMKYSRCHWGEKGDMRYFVMTYDGEYIEDGDYGYYPIFSDVYDENGNMLHSDIYGYVNGVVITMEYTEFPGGFDRPAAIYTFTNEDTGEVIFTFDEHKYMLENPDNINVYTSVSVGAGGCVLSVGRAPTPEVYDMYYISADKVVVLSEIMADKVTGNYSFDMNSSLYYGTDGNDCMNISYNLIEFDEEYGYKKVIGTENCIYDFEKAVFIDYTAPADENYMNIANILVNKQIIVYSGSGDYRNKLLLADYGGNILLRDVTDGWFHTDADNYKDYMGFIDENGAGYCNMDGSETVRYDDATVFAGNYSFVVDNGMGNFINRSFEAVSTSIPATNSIIFEHSDIIYLEAQNKYYTFG